MSGLWIVLEVVALASLGTARGSTMGLNIEASGMLTGPVLI